MTLAGRLKFLAHDSAVYGLAAAIGRFASLITFPVIVRHLSVSDYGVFDILQMLGGFLTVFLIFGQDSSVARYFFEYKDEETRKDLISQSFLLRVYVFIVCIPLIWLSGTQALQLLSIGEEFKPALMVLLLQVPLIAIMNFSVVLLRVTFARNRFIFLSVGFSFTQAALWLLAILVFDATVYGILLSGLIASSIFAVIAIFFIREWLKFTFRMNYIWQMMPYALPYGAISALRTVVPLVERSLIAFLISVDALGLYAAGAKITMLFSIFAFAFQSAWEPFALSIGGRLDSNETYNLVLKIFVLLSCSLVLVLTSLAEPVISLLATEKFSAAALIVFPLTLALAVEAISWITEIGVILKRRTSLKLAAYVLGALASFGSILILAPMFGLAGVAMGVLAGSIVKTVSVTIFAQKVHDLKWDMTAFIVILPITAVGGIVIVLAANAYGTPIAILTCAGAVSIMTLLFYLIVLTAEDRLQIRSFSSRVLAKFGL